MGILKVRSKIGIDLGTESIRVVIKNKGIVINEPAIIAVETLTNEVLAVGNLAKEMIGKTPEKIEALKPLSDSAIADLNATELIVKDIFARLKKDFNVVRPDVLINIHVGSTELEKRAVYKLLKNVGVNRAFFVEEPIAAALGAGIDVFSKDSFLVINIGSGSTEVASLSEGKVISSSSARIGGEKLDLAIIEYVKRNFNVEIGKNASENIKKQIAYGKPIVKKGIEVKGRDIITGFPKQIEISSLEVYEAIKDYLREILDTVKLSMQRVPPELAVNIKKTGILLTGGSAKIRLLDEYLSDNLKINVVVADEPIESVAKGLLMIINDEEMFKKLTNRRR